MYVDPRDGPLKRTDKLDWYKALAKSKPIAPVERFVVSDLLELRRLDGLWFEIALATSPAPEYLTVMRTATPSPAGRQSASLSRRRLWTP